MMSLSTVTNWTPQRRGLAPAGAAAEPLSRSVAEPGYYVTCDTLSRLPVQPEIASQARAAARPRIQAIRQPLSRSRSPGRRRAVTVAAGDRGRWRLGPGP